MMTEYIDPYAHLGEFDLQRWWNLAQKHAKNNTRTGIGPNDILSFRTHKDSRATALNKAISTFKKRLDDRAKILNEYDSNFAGQPPDNFYRMAWLRELQSNLNEHVTTLTMIFKQHYDIHETFRTPIPEHPDTIRYTYWKNGHEHSFLGVSAVETTNNKITYIEYNAKDGSLLSPVKIHKNTYIWARAGRMLGVLRWFELSEPLEETIKDMALNYKLLKNYGVPEEKIVTLKLKYA